MYCYMTDSLYTIIALFKLNIQPVQQYNYFQSSHKVRQCAPLLLRTIKQPLPAQSADPQTKQDIRLSGCWFIFYSTTNI